MFQIIPYLYMLLVLIIYSEYKYNRNYMKGLLWACRVTVFDPDDGSSRVLWNIGILRSECGGTRWRTGGEVKRKLVNGVGSQYSHTASECGVSSITNTDAHTLAASSRLNWLPCRFKWTCPFRRKTKSGFCVCAIRFRTSSKLQDYVVLVANYRTVWCYATHDSLIINYMLIWTNACVPFFVCRELWMT